eukprot:Lankesteria_metandrocarpae@DN3867_c0_g1_i1.p1
MLCALYCLCSSSHVCLSICFFAYHRQQNSISAVQWLCNADNVDHSPFQRLALFFNWLRNSLAIGGRAVFQFYPSCSAQTEMITSAAMRCGFGGGLVVDYPQATRARKYYLCLWAGVTGAPAELPKGLDDAVVAENEALSGGDKRFRRRRQKKNVKDKNWILNKKESQRKKGGVVRRDTKYTGRKRHNAF